VTPAFAVHPAVRPVPDLRLRAEPRDGLNLLCDISDWRDGWMLHYLQEIHEPVRIHRKAWEFGKCLAGFHRLGVIEPRAVGLSVGAGAERPLFYLASHIQTIVASDLYESQAGSWGWGDDFIDRPAAHAPFPYREDGLVVKNMSGLELEFANDTFDFAYSLSSIEHFGGHRAARQAMREMARVVKPGGVVCVVTELQLSQHGAPDIFTYPDLEEYIIRGSGLRLIEPQIDLRISESLLAYPSHMFEDPDDVSPRIVMSGWANTAATWGSIILFLRK
jgi:SAM-dependent methyltransferase